MSHSTDSDDGLQLKSRQKLTFKPIGTSHLVGKLEDDDTESNSIESDFSQEEDPIDDAKEITPPSQSGAAAIFFSGVEKEPELFIMLAAETQQFSESEENEDATRRKKNSCLLKGTMSMMQTPPSRSFP